MSSLECMSVIINDEKCCSTGCGYVFTANMMNNSQ